MFFGREVQMDELKSLWRKRTSSLVVVSGRRRIGKSTLVEKFAAESSCAFVEISGLAPDKDMTNEKQLANFCERLSVQTATPVAAVGGWPKAFDALFVATRKTGRLVGRVVRGRVRTAPSAHGAVCLGARRAYGGQAVLDG